MQLSSPRFGILIGILLLILAAVFFVWQQPVTEQGMVHPPVTDLVLTAKAAIPVGEVTLIRDGNEMPVTEGLVLQEGDIVRTGEGSVSLEFFSGSRVALDGDTEVRVDTANVNRTNQRDQRVGITLLSGRLWARVLKLLEVESSFAAHTAGITATVRGTAFAMTSHPGTAGSARRVDLFDGQLNLAVMQSGLEGMLEAGFTFTDGAGFPPSNPFIAHIQPTPDDVRNDHWIRAQLRADRAFIERVSEIRRNLGDAASYNEVGEEAGPFTLDQEGVEHSGYQSLEIRMDQPVSVLQAGQTVTLRANAHLYENGAVRQENVTDQATWRLSDTSLASINQRGVLTAKEGAGIVMVTARWNDGSHEHSHTIAIPIGEFMADFSPPVLTAPSR